MRRSLGALIRIASLAAASCAPELGECDPSAAVEVAYEPVAGMSAYEGQALVIKSCGHGRFCHAEDARGGDRYGVPAGLDLDVRLAGMDAAVDSDAVERLERGRRQVAHHARAILHTIDLGTMPPGAAGQAVMERGPAFGREEGASLVALPRVSEPEGREILRNWLACGALVVERPMPREDGAPAVVVAARELTPIEPTWESIFRDLLGGDAAGGEVGGRGCAVLACHGGTGAGFRVTTSSRTFDALVNAPASGAGCDATGTLVVPGDPEASLFYRKLAARSDGEVCGDAMPLGGFRLRDADLEAVRAWIEGLAIEP